VPGFGLERGLGLADHRQARLAPGQLGRQLVTARIAELRILGGVDGLASARMASTSAASSASRFAMRP